MAAPSSSSSALFAALGLAPTPDRAAVRAAYASIARADHPDRGGDGGRFAAAAAAFSALTADGDAALARHAAAAAAEAAPPVLPAGSVPLAECGTGDDGPYVACRCGDRARVPPADAAALAGGRVGAVLAPCDGCSAVWEVVQD
jgi:hypothetical protein